MLVEFGQASLLAKARSQPERVQQVLDKMRTDGVLPTLESVFNKLGQPLPLGYCNAGTVIAVGDGVTGFAVGDRVVSNGAHAEIVNVPQNLCARIPDNVSDSDAAFTVLAAIGFAGGSSRRAGPRGKSSCHGAGANRPAYGANVARQRLPSAGHGLQPRSLGNGRTVRRRNDRPIGCQ